MIPDNRIIQACQRRDDDDGNSVLTGDRNITGAQYVELPARRSLAKGDGSPIRGFGLAHTPDPQGHRL